VPVTLQFHDRELITRLRCPGCANHLEPFKLAEVIQEEELICSCGATRRAGGLDRVRSFTREQARPFLERTCGELGLPNSDVVSATNGSENVDILIGWTFMRDVLRILLWFLRTLARHTSRAFPQVRGSGICLLSSVTQVTS